MEGERALHCTVLSQPRMQHSHLTPIRTTVQSVPIRPFLFTVVTAAVGRGPSRKEDVMTLEKEGALRITATLPTSFYRKVN